MQAELGVDGVRSSDGALPPSRAPWDAPCPEMPARARARRAALVAAVWAASALPVAAGWQRCTVATLFHHPCPGCGMTRALRLLAAGDLQGSLRMHPLALPALLAAGMLVASTVWATYALGTPFVVHRSRFGRAAIAVASVVYALVFLLWVARWLGYFGGPVPVG